MAIQQTNTAICFHCHEPAVDELIFYENHSFCCNGCKQVYQLLSEHELGAYYSDQLLTGIRPNKRSKKTFEILDDPTIRQAYIDFQEGNTVKITLHLPQIHCASCIYLLEHLAKLNPGIIHSFVNFPKKQCSITIDESKIALSELAILLTKIGYEPNFTKAESRTSNLNKHLLFQLGFAGFAFGSIMLWSFPEYLGIDQTYNGFRNLSAYLSLVVSLPVFFFSAQDFFRSALGAIRVKSLNLDIPIAIGILALYARSCYAIFSNEGPGYMDSFAAFIFFLLIGKWFQGKTYQWLSFERDFKAYFPIAVIRKKGTKTALCPIDELIVGDQIQIRNEEIIPCDSILLSEKATIDYSFVSGESDWVEKKEGDLIYAGGKICGESAELSVLKISSRSELTQLWNEQHTKQEPISFKSRQDRISRYFIAAVLFIAAGSAISWAFIDPRQIPEIVTAVLIVACPCALALSVPFTYGNMMRKLGRKGFYLRNTSIIERIQQCTHIVFDKTGTLTEQDTKNVEYQGKSLNPDQLEEIYAMTKHATHPYARAIHSWIKHQLPAKEVSWKAIEYAGLGIESQTGLKLGSAVFVGFEEPNQNESCSYIANKEGVLGKFSFRSNLRPGLSTTISKLGGKVQFTVISGDTGRDLELIHPFFPKNTQFLFEQSPLDKKRFIDQLQKSGKRVLMIGDGLNDAGALNSAFVGLALSENLVRFTPSSDAILQANHLQYLAEYMEYIQQGKNFLKIGFVFSLLYNLTGIGFAVSGTLTPFIATILMPLSSITVVGLATFLTLRKKLPPLQDTSTKVE
jgi:P-type Cu+ transporter